MSIFGGGGNVSNGKVNNLSNGATVVRFDTIGDCVVIIFAIPKLKKRKNSCNTNYICD